MLSPVIFHPWLIGIAERSPGSAEGVLTTYSSCCWLRVGLGSASWQLAQAQPSCCRMCLSAVISAVNFCLNLCYLPSFLLPGCREQVIQPMGITPSGNLAPMENAIRDMADERSSSDSDLGLD